MSRPVKLLFVVTEDWYFVSHRLPFAVAAMRAGMSVAIATNVGEHRALLERAGLEVYPWTINRGGTGLWGELRSAFGLWRIYRAVRPDLLHHVAIKPVLYGSFIAKVLGIKHVVNALGGMGFLFTEHARSSRARTLVVAGFRWLLKGRGTCLVLQNADDAALMVQQAGLPAEAIRLIRGVGVNTAEFDVAPEPDGPAVVLLPARMLADKGVREFVEAARLLRARGRTARFVLVGGTDPCNPAAIDEQTLRAWVDAGDVEWLGRRSDMPRLYAGATIVCLPSYREGLPKALLEAAACGRAIVTTDVPGCRDVVRHGENGLLVPARDGAALALAIDTLLADPALRRRMAACGRAAALAEFSETAIVEQTLDTYRMLLSGRRAEAAGNFPHEA